MKLHLWGLDFRRSSSEERARLFLPEDRRATALRKLMETGFKDLVYLWTCNRIEFYTTAEDYFCDTRSRWVQLLGELGLGESVYFQGYHFEGKAALRHLLRVASSLESLVVGEAQILGQLKSALAQSDQAGIAIDSSMKRCFDLAFKVAKEVRTHTEIAKRSVSVASLGLNVLQSHEREFPIERVAVVGRSPISILILKWFEKNRPEIPLIWVNRTKSVLMEFGVAQKATVLSLDEFLASPPDFSHLFTATSSPEPLFGERFFQKLSHQKQRLVFDFAEPPDVERFDYCHVHLIQVGDLALEAEENKRLRGEAIQQCELIIESALRDFFHEQKEAPLLRDFNAIEPRFFEELEKSYAEIENSLPSEHHPKAKKIAETLVKKNLHQSREHLKEVLHKTVEPSP